MKFEPVSNDANECLKAVFKLVAADRGMSETEAEWIVRRLARLTSDGLSVDAAGERIEAEAVGEPWAYWPDDYPRF